MTFSVRRSFGEASTRPEYYADQVYAALDVAPTDRIGPPRSRRIGRSLFATLLALGAVGAGWAHYDDPARWPKVWEDAMTAAAPLLDRVKSVSISMPSLRPATAAPETAGSAPPKLGAADAAPSALGQRLAASMPAAAPETPVAAEPPERTVALAPPVATIEEPVTVAQKPAAADPNLVRASAAGLHPDMSKVLLARLSKADYQNAGVAIRTALAETPDDGVLFWPLKVKAGSAQFRVHFVPGAAPECRRYVVTVAKDGWQTTALPMDNCSVKRTALKATDGKAN